MNFNLYQGKMLKLPVQAGLLSAIQPPFNTFNFHWSLGYIRKLAFGSCWGNYFSPSFVCSQHMAPRNIKLAQTPFPLWVPIQILVKCSLRDSFLGPREIHVRPVQNLNHRHLDLTCVSSPPGRDGNSLVTSFKILPSFNSSILKHT